MTNLRLQGNSVVFERLHFKSATANLVPKSKSKENELICYRIVVNLYAQVQSSNLLLVSLISDPLVVR